MAKKDKSIDDILDSYTVKQLFDIVRRGMIWRGKAIEKMDKMASAQQWKDENNITPGIHIVKAIVIYEDYFKWCKARGLTENSILGANIFGRFLKANFKFTRLRNSNHYYINKVLYEDEEEKKKRQELFKKRTAKKRFKEEQTQET